jgi:hypothetical protein
MSQQLVGVDPQFSHANNLKRLTAFLAESQLCEAEVIKVELRRGEEPTVHVVNHAFIKLAPTNTTWQEEIGCGGNKHRSVKALGVKLVSVFRQEV